MFHENHNLHRAVIIQSFLSVPPEGTQGRATQTAADAVRARGGRGVDLRQPSPQPLLDVVVLVVQ